MKLALKFAKLLHVTVMIYSHFHIYFILSEVYHQLVAADMILPQPEKSPPTVPMDYKWAQELGLIRKPAAFMSSICDERGEELLYAGMPISDVFKVCMLSCRLIFAQFILLS